MTAFVKHNGTNLLTPYTPPAAELQEHVIRRTYTDLTGIVATDHDVVVWSKPAGLAIVGALVRPVVQWTAGSGTYFRIGCGKHPQPPNDVDGIMEPTALTNILGVAPAATTVLVGKPGVYMNPGSSSFDRLVAAATISVRYSSDTQLQAATAGEFDLIIQYFDVQDVSS